MFILSCMRGGGGHGWSWSLREWPREMGKKMGGVSPCRGEPPATIVLVRNAYIDFWSLTWLEDEEDAWGGLSNFIKVDGLGVMQQVISEVLPHGGNLLLLFSPSSYSSRSPFPSYI